MMKNEQLSYYCNIILPRKEWLFAFVIMLLSSFSLSAQESKTISGTVYTSKEQLGLPGVNVVVKGSNAGTITDINGKYSINASSKDVLVYSFVGYEEQEIAIGNKTSVNVSLVEVTNSLNEVVVVGYGTQKKSDLTGAVSVVSMKDARKTISYDVAKMLQGQAPGVTVQSSGEPGGFVNIKIRGISSFKNNNPLFVIDGMIVDEPYDFAPGEIESMQILKDASSAAIYGVRGANGVVIITTKKGKLGAIEIKFKSLFGVQNVAQKWDLMNREQYQQVVRQAEANAPGLTSFATGNYPADPTYINNVDTDWQDAAYKTGTIQNQALTFSGGTEDLGYNFNLDYFKNTSYVEAPQDYKRLSTLLNLNGKKGKFKYGSKLGFTQSDKEAFNEYLPGQTAVNELLLAIPTMPVYDPNRLGGYGGADNATQRAITLNVIGFNNLIQNMNKRNRFIGNVWGELELLKGLKYKISANFDRLDWHTRLFNPPSDLGWYYITTNDEAALDLTNGSQTRTLLDNLLTYNLTVKKHTFDLLGGLIQEDNRHNNHISRGVGYTPGENSHLDYADDRNGREYENRITNISFVSRLNYAFDDRYLLTANFRQDKSSIFPESNKKGNFYSFSAGWKLSNEKFIKLPKWVNTVKLRGGYGEIGNNAADPYSYTSTTNPFVAYTFGNSIPATAPGTTVVSLRDPNLKWEVTKTTNAAIELGFLNNKLQFSAEYFIKKSTDILAPVPLPYSTGSFPASIITNAGTMQNKGLEFTASYSNNDNAFKYTISANLGTLENEILEIGEFDIPIPGNAAKSMVGRSLGEIYAFEAIGIFQSAADVSSSPTQINAAPGDVKFKDINGDGAITDDDRTFQGVTIPKYSYGFNFNSSYKNFDFGFMLQGHGGNKIYNGQYAALMGGQYSNGSTDMLNYWTPTNTNTDVPRPVIGDPNANGRASSRFVQKGDYMRLQNVQLGYTLPLVTNKFIKKARVYVSGQNVFTVTKAKGVDPDFTNNDGLFSRGFAQGSYPNPRTFAMGVEVDF